MRTFQDILKEYPITKSTNTGITPGSSNTLTRWYNMYWGTLTDTHMQMLEDNIYTISGSRLTESLWEKIRYSFSLPSAPNTYLPHTWESVMKANNIEWEWIVMNGTKMIGLRANTNELRIPPPTLVSNCVNPVA